VIQVQITGFHRGTGETFVLLNYCAM